MSAKPTPGPWAIIAPNFVYALNEDNTNRFDLSVRGGYVTQRKDSEVRVDTSEIEANARLIATAPDLLEACQQWILERDNPAPCWVMKKQAEDKMRAAIAKATGKEQA